MIVGAWEFTATSHRQVEDWPTALGACRSAGEGFVWISVDDPEPAELESIGRALGAHPLAIEDAVQGGQRPKLDAYEDAHLLVLRPLDYVEATSDVETRELTVFLSAHYVVTVRRGGHTALRAVRYHLHDASPALRSTPVGVLHGILDAVVDHYVEVADALSDDLDELETRVFADRPDVDARTIYRLKREVQEVRRAVGPLVLPVSRLARGDEEFVPKKARPFFADVLDHLVRTAERVDGLDRSLTDVLSVHLTQVSVQQNEDARRISAWAAMALVPTLIAGIYGMNFTHMPELQWHLGYPFALGLMLVVCLVLHRAFKRSGWL